LNSSHKIFVTVLIYFSTQSWIKIWWYFTEIHGEITIFKMVDICDLGFSKLTIFHIWPPLPSNFASLYRLCK